MLEQTTSQLDYGWAALNPEDRSRAAKFVADAWSNEQLAARFQLNPRDVLREYGVDLPGDVNLELPPCPTDDILDERLAGDTATEIIAHCGCRACRACVGCGGCGGCVGCSCVGCGGCGCRACRACRGCC